MGGVDSANSPKPHILAISLEKREPIPYAFFSNLGNSYELAIVKFVSLRELVLLLPCGVLFLHSNFHFIFI